MFEIRSGEEFNRKREGKGSRWRKEHSEGPEVGGRSPEGAGR